MIQGNIYDLFQFNMYLLSIAMFNAKDLSIFYLL